MKNQPIKGILLSLVSAILLTGCGDPGDRAVRSGVKALERGKWPQAASAFRKALEERSAPADKAYLYNLLGKAQFHADKLEAAAESFQKSRGYNPDQMEATYNLGVLHCARGELYAGATLLEEAALINNEDTQAYEFLAAEYLKVDKVDEALMVLRKAQERQPQSPRVLTAIAMAGLDQEGDIFAVTHLNQALKQNAEYAPALFNLGRIHDIRLKDRVGSVKYYKRFLAVADKGDRVKQAKAAVTRLGGDASPPASATRPASPPLVTPKKPLRRIEPVAAAPNTIDQQVTHLLDSARKEMREGDTTGALNLCLQAAAIADLAGNQRLHEKALNSAVSLCPGMAKAHFTLGTFYQEQERFSEAVRAFGSATTLKPDWSTAHMSHAAAAIDAHEYQVALEALRQAVKTDGENADALWALALFYDTQLKMSDRARDAYAQFTEKFPGDARVDNATRRLTKLGGTPEAPLKLPGPPSGEDTLRHERILISAVSGRDDDAEASAPSKPEPPSSVGADAASLTPPSAPAISSPRVESSRNQAIRLFNQGTLYQAKGNFDEAARFYRQSIQADAGYGPPHYNLGIILQKQGQLKEAEQAYNKALQIDAGLSLARYNLALIYKGNNRSGEAIRELRKVIESKSNYAPAYYELGLLYARDAQTRYLARNYYARFLQLAPNDPAAAQVRKWLQNN